ncbi:MAG: hypothetical protein CSA62_08570 [Planctomycetota bacterium]|nr:MAG: hypothetical protein CSA62_08570 [Planctomycetota bacterium]
MIPVPNNPDPQLLRRARLREHAAFRELHSRFAHAIRALIEARRPGSAQIDELCVQSFERIFSHLQLFREEHWLHRDFVRQTRELLESKMLRADSAGADCPSWLATLPIEPREVLFFEQRAAGRSPFPAHEYFGITDQAYQARAERAQKHLLESRQELPAEADEGWLERQWLAIQASLPPEPERRTRRGLPRMPPALSFGIVVALSMLGLSLVFINTEARQAPPPFQPKVITQGTSEVLPRIRIVAEPGAQLRQLDYHHFELLTGRVRFEHQGWERPRIQLGSRQVALNPGSYTLSFEAGQAYLAVENGRAAVSWQDENGRSRRRLLPSGEMNW